jgi:predicted permease
MYDQLSQFVRKVTYIFQSSRFDRELAEELETHRALVANSMNQKDGRSSGRVMGNMTLAKEQRRELWTFTFIESIWIDLRHALRGLRRSPAFSLTAIASLALGIGANTAIFSFINAILLKSLLVTFARSYRGETSGVVWKLHTVDELAKRSPALAGLVGVFSRPVSFSTGDTPHWLMAELVTGKYFETLEVKPLAGRLFNDDDVRNARANPVCVLSYGLWQREFAGDLGLVGRPVLLNGHSYRVVGITPRGFYGAQLERRIDLQIPATRIGDFMPAFGDSTGVDWLKSLSWLTPMARVKPGLTRPVAQDQTQPVFEEIQAQDAGGRLDQETPKLRLRDGSQGFNTMINDFGRPIEVLMGVVAVVLLIACANLASLLLARAQARSKEFAVRMSIGSSRSRLVRNLFVESLLLAGFGGIAGIALAYWIVRTLLAFFNAGKSPVAAFQVTLDVNVLLFSIALSFVTAILFGFVPAWQASRTDLLAGLQLNYKGNSTRLPLRRLLVAAQIALSLVIVFAAGLLTQTLRSLKTVDLGYEPQHVISLSVDPAANGHTSAEVTAILDELLTRTRALPSVTAASLASTTPNGSMEISMSIDVPGYTPKQPGDDVVAFNFVTPGYFKTMGQPLLRGRDFDEHDAQNAPRVAISTEKLAKRYFSGRDPLGRKFRQGGGDIEIVGMARDARDHDARSAPEATAYLPEKQGQTSGLTLLVRTGTDPERTIPSLLAIVRGIDPHTPVYSVHTLSADVDAGISTERILGYLSTLFAVLATLLAGIGLYGVAAYSVVRRTREIGVRFAVGAQTSSVVGLFVRETVLLLLLGLCIGGPLAVAGAHALKSLLFGVAATDPLTLVLSILVLLGASFLATAIPLSRASRVNPVTALRYE